MLPLDPFANSLFPVLERLQTQSAKDWSSVLLLLRRIYPTATLGPTPLLSLPQYPPHNVFEDTMDNILSSVADLCEGHPATWPVSLPAASLVFQLYHMHTEAALRFSNGNNPNPDRPADLRHYMYPMNIIARALLKQRGKDVFALRHGWISQFTTRQLTTIKQHQQYSETPEEVYYIMLRHPDMHSWLGLLYESLDRRYARRPHDCRVHPVALLDVAELITEAYDGQRYQAEYAASLAERGLLSAASDYLSPEQLYALRPAADIWYELYRLCLPCYRDRHDDGHRSRKAWFRCSGCKRAYYCTTFCQARDWNSHKEVCELWRRVNRRSSEPEMQARFACMELDPESELVNI